MHLLSPPPRLEFANRNDSEIPNGCGASDLDGDDGVLQDFRAATYTPSAQHDQIRSCRYVLSTRGGGMRLADAMATVKRSVLFLEQKRKGGK